jgi:hypothetical protein
MMLKKRIVRVPSFAAGIKSFVRRSAGASSPEKQRSIVLCGTTLHGSTPIPNPFPTSGRSERRDFTGLSSSYLKVNKRIGRPTRRCQKHRYANQIALRPDGTASARQGIRRERRIRVQARDEIRSTSRAAPPANPRSAANTPRDRGITTLPRVRSSVSRIAAPGTASVASSPLGRRSPYVDSASS